MAAEIILTTNYDFTQRFQLLRNRESFDMSDATLVAAALIDPLDGAIILEAVEQSDLISGADWATSLVVVRFSEAETEAIETSLLEKYIDVETTLLMEIRVELDSVSEAWVHQPIRVKRGYIVP